MFGPDLRCLVVVGAQWGDEGKGKLVDVLSEGADVVARYQGGANAGHTVVIGESQLPMWSSPVGWMPENTRSMESAGHVKGGPILRPARTRAS